jgi:hypothetical protein
MHDTWRSLSILPPGMPLEVVGVIFIQRSKKATPSSGQGAPPKDITSTQKGAQGVTRGGQCVDPTSYYEGDNDKDVGDSDEELIAATEREVKH